MQCNEGQRSDGSKVRLETGRQRDGRTRVTANAVGKQTIGVAQVKLCETVFTLYSRLYDRLYKRSHKHSRLYNRKGELCK